MPVANLVHLPKSDGFKAKIGGPPKGSHAYDYGFFGISLTGHGVCVGISPGQYRHLVANDMQKHMSELDEIIGQDENLDCHWQAALMELMLNNIATYYIARLIVNALGRMAVPSLAELRPAQMKPSLFNNNHMIVIGIQRICNRYWPTCL
jgi:hypothetical protein